MKRQALIVLGLSVALAGCNTSYSYFEDDTTGVKPKSTNFFYNAMQTAGVVPKDKAEVKPTPRAPLAMPRTSELPSPSSGRSAAHEAVNFPVDQNDQNEARQRKLSELLNRDAPGVDTRENPRSVQAANVRLPAEAQQQSRDRRDVTKIWNDDAFKPDPTKRIRGIRIRRPGEQVLTEDGQAMERKYLIQPPTEYRTPAATAALPEKGDIENSEWVRSRLYKKAAPKPGQQ